MCIQKKGSALFLVKNILCISQQPADGNLS